ncbi:uncharacterized protein TRIADDRAFT_35011, partial [Trichoplax adhaerens]
REIIFTSGATESDNLAIKGAVKHYANGKRRRVVTVKTEHKAVLDSVLALEREGFEVTFLDVDQDGRLSVEEIEKNLGDDVVLLSVMHVNNETGVVQDIKMIGNICRRYGVIFHVDAAQSAGKLPINLKTLDVDLMSFSAHKLYGPKGVGALYVSRNPRINLQEQISGGGHERGMRSGTIPTHQVVGMGMSFELAGERMSRDYEKFQVLASLFWEEVRHLKGAVRNGGFTNTCPWIFNISVPNVDAEAVMMSLKTLAISSGSACNSHKESSSHVLRAMNVSDALIESSFRFSFGRFTTESDVAEAAERFVSVIKEWSY